MARRKALSHRERLAKALREGREEVGFSQPELGGKLRPPVDGTAISRWESGRVIPGPGHMARLIRLLRLPEEPTAVLYYRAQVERAEAVIGRNGTGGDKPRTPRRPSRQD